MTVKNYVLVSSMIFALIAVLQMLRVFMQWSLIIDGWNAPIWVSVIAAIVAGLLAFAGFRSWQQIHRYLT
jgi:hypothetical protein